MRTLRRSPLCGVVSVALLIVVRSTQAASCCPGDINGDDVVTIDEILRAVNAALNGCAAVAPVPCQGGGLLTTGQTQCDQGSGTLGACPGSPAGQDAEVGAGVPPSYTDNGDGTITDNVTGLMWEKLSQGDGSIHDVNNIYTWSDAFSVKIAELKSACFAGHCDWRLPNRRELESLVDLGRVPPVDPAFNTQCVIPGPSCTVATCSCTQLNFYWSSTTYQDIPNYAWAVDGNTGRVAAYEKYNPPIPYYVRAVRGGL